MLSSVASSTKDTTFTNGLHDQKKSATTFYFPWHTGSQNEIVAFIPSNDFACSSSFLQLPTSRALKLYTSLSSTSTTNGFALMLKRKLNKCTVNYDDRLRHFNETLTNWHWMSNAKKNHAFATNDSTWHVQTIKHEPWFLSKKNCALNRDAYLNGGLITVSVDSPRPLSCKK